MIPMTTCRRSTCPIVAIPTVTGRGTSARTWLRPGCCGIATTHRRAGWRERSVEAHFGEPRGNWPATFTSDVFAIRGALKRHDCAKAKRLLKDAAKAITQMDLGAQASQRIETRLHQKQARRMLRGLGAKLSRTCLR